MPGAAHAGDGLGALGVFDCARSDYLAFRNPAARRAERFLFSASAFPRPACRLIPIASLEV